MNITHLIMSIEKNPVNITHLNDKMSKSDVGKST